MLNDPLARRLKRGFVLANPLLDGHIRLAHLRQCPRRRLGGASPPVEFVAQGTMPERPCLELRAGLVLLLGQKLSAAFQLAKLGLDRCGFSRCLVTLLLSGETVRVECRLAFARRTLGVRGTPERAIRRLQLDPRGLGRVGQLIHDAASGLLRGAQSLELAL